MKIICIGRNYAEHAKELNNAVPEKPVFFLKPDTALLTKNKAFYYPDFSTDIHYEAELVIKINKVGKHIDEKFAARYYHEIGLGIDITARDLQNEAKKKGLPWEIAKSFDNSAPISEEFIDINSLPKNINFKLIINDIEVQNGFSDDMIFSVDKIIAYVSKFYTLKIGDLIFTGTPSGVGPLKIGDRLKGYIQDKLMIDFEVK